jgi:hypothetical protein
MTNAELANELERLHKKATPDWEIERKYPHNSEQACTAVTTLFADVGRVIFDTSNADDNLIERDIDEDSASYYETGHDTDLQLAVLLRNSAPQILEALRSAEKLERAEALLRDVAVLRHAQFRDKYHCDAHVLIEAYFEEPRDEQGDR